MVACLVMVLFLASSIYYYLKSLSQAMCADLRQSNYLVPQPNGELLYLLALCY